MKKKGGFLYSVNEIYLWISLALEWIGVPCEIFLGEISEN